MLLGVAAPADLIKNRNLTPFNIGYAVDLQELSRADAQPLADGLEQVFPGQGAMLLDRIFAWTNGHPYLTQKLCHAAIEQTDPGALLNVDALVQRFFLNKDAQNEDNLQFVRSNVEASAERRRLVQIYKRVYADQRVSEDERSPLHARLKLIGLVRSYRGTLQVRNPIYRHVFNAAWIKQNTPIEWTKLVTIGSIVVAILSISIFLYFQRVRENERFAFNQSTFLDQRASTSFRMSSLARMCDMRPSATRTIFFALPQEQQLALFQAEELKTIDWNLVIIADCLQPGLAALPPMHRQALAGKINLALHKRCAYKHIEDEQAECHLSYE